MDKTRLAISNFSNGIKIKVKSELGDTGQHAWRKSFPFNLNAKYFRERNGINMKLKAEFNG